MVLSVISDLYCSIYTNSDFIVDCLIYCIGVTESNFFAVCVGQNARGIQTQKQQDQRRSLSLSYCNIKCVGHSFFFNVILLVITYTGQF